MTNSLKEYFGDAFFTQCMATMGWLFRPDSPKVVPAPQVNLRKWYAPAHAADAEDPEVQLLQRLIRGLSNDGFKSLRQWLFEARVHSTEVNTPLMDLLGNKVLADTGAFREDSDKYKIELLKHFSVAKICSTPICMQLSDLYGRQTWTLGKVEWDAIHESTCIYTSNLLPGSFFLDLVRIVSDSRFATRYDPHAVIHSG